MYPLITFSIFKHCRYLWKLYITVCVKDLMTYLSEMFISAIINMLLTWGSHMLYLCFFLLHCLWKITQLRNLSYLLKYFYYEKFKNHWYVFRFVILLRGKPPLKSFPCPVFISFPLPISGACFYRVLVIRVLVCPLMFCSNTVRPPQRSFTLRDGWNIWNLPTNIQGQLVYLRLKYTF